MDFMDAMAWAEANKDDAKRWFNRYGYMTPYGLEDFEQLYLESAITASIVLGDKPQTEFEAIFVTTLQNGMSSLIPGYGFKEGQKGGVGPNVSMSIHSNNCISYHSADLYTEIADEDSEFGFLESLSDKDDFVNPAFNAEHAYNLVEPHLDDRQKTVLTHSLGLTEKGALSVREIEKETSISKSTVSRDLSKIFSLVTDLVSKGVIAVFSPLPAPSQFEFELRGSVAAEVLSAPMFASDNMVTHDESFWSGFGKVQPSDGYNAREFVFGFADARSLVEKACSDFGHWVSSVFQKDSAIRSLSKFEHRPSGAIRSLRSSPTLAMRSDQEGNYSRSRFGVVWGSSLSAYFGVNDWLAGCITRGDPQTGFTKAPDNYEFDLGLQGVG